MEELIPAVEGKGVKLQRVKSLLRKSEFDEKMQEEKKNRSRASCGNAQVLNPIQEQPC